LISNQIDPDELHRLSISPNKKENEQALRYLVSGFFSLPNKLVAWNDLIFLTNHKDRIIGRRAAQALGFAYAYMPDKIMAWKDILNVTHSKNYLVRLGAIKAIELSFLNIPDKTEAWYCLEKFTYDRDRRVRRDASFALRLIFSYHPDINIVWNTFLRLTKRKDFQVMVFATVGLSNAFRYMPNKKVAWDEYEKLLNSSNSELPFQMILWINPLIPYVPDKVVLWEIITKCCRHPDPPIRSLGASKIWQIYPYLPDKEDAWSTLFAVSNDHDSDVRVEFSYFLDCAYSHIPDKDAAWKILLKLVNDSNDSVKCEAIKIICNVYSQLSDKVVAWNIVSDFSRHRNPDIRSCVASYLRNLYPYVSDKDPVWKTLLNLVNDSNDYCQTMALRSFGCLYAQLPDKKMAWDILKKFSTDSDEIHRRDVAIIIGKNFPNLPNSEDPLKILFDFAVDKSDRAREGAAEALGFAYPMIADKGAADMLIKRLTQDPDPLVRTVAYHSAGKMTIHNACNSADDEIFRLTVEKAIRYFEQSFQESELLPYNDKIGFDNPSGICYPLYRAFYAVTFQKKSFKETTEKFILEAKNATILFEAREELIAIIEKLAHALSEVEELHISDPALKSHLQACSQYCFQAETLIASVETERPSAAGILRKGAQIVQSEIDKINAEINAQAEEICVLTRKESPPIRELGSEIHRLVKQIEEGKDVQNLTRSTIQGLNDKIVLIPSSILPVEIRQGIIELLIIIQDSIVTDDHQKICNSLDEIKHLIMKIESNSIQIQSNICKIDSHIDKLEDKILLRFDQTEREIIGEIISHFSKADKQIINDIFIALATQKLSQKDLSDLETIVKQTHMALIEFKNEIHRDQQEISDTIEHFIELQKDSSDYALKHQILVTIPILPFVSYNVALGSPAIKLRTLWDGVKRIWEKMPDSTLDNVGYTDFSQAP